MKCRSRIRVNCKLLNDKKRIKIVSKNSYARLYAEIIHFSI